MSKTFKNLWPQITSFGSLLEAYGRARKGQRFRADAMRFSENLEEEILSIRKELESGSYRTSEYRTFTIHEPKKREIAALRFRDRVVQHSLVAAIEPIYEARFIGDNYACRVARGTHAAADRLTRFLRMAHRRWPQTYILKADVQRFFPSVDHGILKQIYRRHIACARTLALLDAIIDSWNFGEGRGLPIGNLTSQLGANIYLNDLDQFIKQSLRRKFYLRYMDDFIVIDHDKKRLQGIRRIIEAFLWDRLRLRLNPKTRIFPAAQGVPFLGFRFWSTHRLLSGRNPIQMRRRLRRLEQLYSSGEINLERVRSTVASWVGHASNAETFRLRRRLLSEFRFHRAATATI